MSETAQVKDWDFDRWMHLAQDDPEQFELQRMQAISALIDSVPAERKLHLQRLQWRVDRVRERAGTPLAATIAISRMMWESFYDLRDHYQGMFGDETGGRRSVMPPTRAKVLKFPRSAHA